MGYEAMMCDVVITYKRFRYGKSYRQAKKKLEFFKNSRKNAFKTLPVGISLNCDWQQEHWCNR